MVKDHSDNERGNLLPPHGLLSDLQQGFFYIHHPTDKIAHTSPYTSRGALAGMRNLSIVPHTSHVIDSKNICKIYSTLRHITMCNKKTIKIYIFDTQDKNKH